MNEDFVPFELAKKLKGKDYPQHIADDAYIVDNYGEEDYQIGDRLPIPIIPDFMDDVSAPTITQVLKWLREEKKLHIIIDYNNALLWNYLIYKFEAGNIDMPSEVDLTIDFNSYEKAALAGIEYVLDNLI